MFEKRRNSKLAIAVMVYQINHRELRLVFLSMCAICLIAFLPQLISLAGGQENTPPASSAQSKQAKPGTQQSQPPANSNAETKSALQDPATPTDVINETLRTIREVENLNKYIEQNEQLQNENKSLKKEVASLAKQVQKLTQEIATQNERLRNQLLALPELKIQSKVIGLDSAQAVLDIGGKSIRIRQGVEMSIPVENGVWTLIHVKKISKDVIEIHFKELERTITLYD